ncbi:MAG TPA: dihydrofolate reductase family protein [Ktedonobacterales bacterium]
MEPVITLFEREPAPISDLPPALAERYGGGLALPRAGHGDRPPVVANFVATIDGVISFAEPGLSGGGEVSGFNEPDRFLMGLLRAAVGAVIFGAGTLRDDAEHVRVAPYIYPELADAYAELRHSLGYTTPHPLNVVVTASGRVDLDQATFHYPNLRVLIATTHAGLERLAGATLPPGVEARAIGGAHAAADLEPAPGAADGGVQLAAPPPISGVDPIALLELLGQEYGVPVALHEGGPHVLGAFLAVGALDELFLTRAPQIAGRASGLMRPALLEGHAYMPGSAPWWDLLSLKRAESHLFLRYRLDRHVADAGQV